MRKKKEIEVRFLVLVLGYIETNIVFYAVANEEHL